MGARRESLLRLQAELLRGGESAEPAGPTLLPFEAAGQVWAVPCDEVARVMMPADLIPLNGYAQLPVCVIGVIASDTEMLSVVDSGLLLGREKSHESLKTRLIVFNEGPLKGVAILVDRVRARVAAPASNDKIEGVNLLDAANLNSRLQAKSPARSQAA